MECPRPLLLLVEEARGGVTRVGVEQGTVEEQSGILRTNKYGQNSAFHSKVYIEGTIEGASHTAFVSTSTQPFSSNTARSMSSSTQTTVPLPKGWSKGTSRTLNNRPYFFHKESKHTQWHFPTPTEAADPIGTKERMMQQQQRKKQKKMPSVAIIVPYRDLHVAQNRAKHLNQFIPHMKQFLGKLVKQGKIEDYHIYIIEQSNDERKFNRGKLLNIGFDYAIKRSEKHPPRHNVFIFHDVDLLPQAGLGEWYAKYPEQPFLSI